MVPHQYHNKLFDTKLNYVLSPKQFEKPNLTLQAIKNQ